MKLMWLYYTCQYLLFIAVFACSGRLCLRVRKTSSVSDIHQGSQLSKPWSVSDCLRLTLGLVGALGGAVELPVTVILNQRKPTCLYTCITLVCGPLLIRHFTMFLLMLLSLDDHLLHILAHRYPAVVTRRRALCAVLLSWVASILSSFAQFIGSDILHTWRGNGGYGGPDGIDTDTTSLGLGDNLTTALPTTQKPKLHNVKVIGKFLPYGGFLSKFYVEDMHNFTYAQLHSSHWGVCSPDTLLSLDFLVYVNGITVFLLPLVCLLGIYLNLLCMKPKPIEELAKSSFSQLRFLAVSIFLLVILCAPIHIIHSLVLFSPQNSSPHLGAQGCVVPLPNIQYSAPSSLHSSEETSEQGYRGFLSPLTPSPLTPADATGGKAVLHGAVEAQWASAKNTLKAQTCPHV